MADPKGCANIWNANNKEDMNKKRLLLTIIFLTGCSNSSYSTVPEVWERAEEIEGKQIRLRGPGYFFTIPYEGLTGCMPGGRQ